jgi:hypothetical protein
LATTPGRLWVGHLNPKFFNFRILFNLPFPSLPSSSLVAAPLLPLLQLLLLLLLLLQRLLPANAAGRIINIVFRSFATKFLLFSERSVFDVTLIEILKKWQDPWTEAVA